MKIKFNRNKTVSCRVSMEKTYRIRKDFQKNAMRPEKNSTKVRQT